MWDWQKFIRHHLGIWQPVDRELKYIVFDIFRLLKAILFKWIEFWLDFNGIRTVGLEQASILADEA